MSDQSTIERIWQAASDCPGGAIDAGIHLDSDICIGRFASTSESQAHFVDVPLDNVVSVIRNDFLKDSGSGQIVAKTWREAVSCLHGKDWGPEVLAYFTKPLLDNSFPAAGAGGGLRLQAVGGAVIVTNGTHRAVAAKAWLLNAEGPMAILKQARLTRFRVPTAIKALLGSAITAQQSLQVCPVHSWDRLHRTASDESISCLVRYPRAYRMKAITLSNKVLDVPLWKFWYHFKVEDGWHLAPWKTVPFDVIQKILDDSWVDSAVLSGLPAPR